MQVVTEVTEVLAAAIDMEKLSKIFFPQTSPFYPCSFSSYYFHFSLFLTLLLIIPTLANSEWTSQSKGT
jgi:hypothetical protein